MKARIGPATHCIRNSSFYPRRNICIRLRHFHPLVRSFAATPSDPKPSTLPDSPPETIPQTSQPTVPTQDTPPSPDSTSSPRAYKSPLPPEKRVYAPMTSQDWSEIESKIPPVPPQNWLESDRPVPLNKDWPISKAEYDILPPDEQQRLANEDFRRRTIDLIRTEKLNDHNHLHPAGTPFRAPMVAYHRGYAPEGTTPPPIQQIPWQLRRPWNWIRMGGIGLFAGALLAAVVAIGIQYQDEFKLRILEKKTPAPNDWSDKARAFYAVALNHRKEGEHQLAVWALQRAIVEAGYRWILEPDKVPEEERRPLDLPNAWVIRTLMLWEIELGTWDKAIGLMEGLSTAYEEENPKNRVLRSDLLRILALPTEKTKGVEAAAALLQTSMAYFGYEIPKNPKETILVPDRLRGNSIFLRALQDYMILQIRHGLKSAKQALPTFLSIAQAYRQTPYQVRDVCSESSVMLNIGEIMYALGHTDESLQWTGLGVDTARKAVKEQPHEESRQRCSECLGNGCNSLGILYEVAEPLCLC